MTKKEPTRFSSNANLVLCKRYLKKGPDFPKCSLCGENHETPEDMLERVSFGNVNYYNLMARLDFLPMSTTLFNAGIEGAGTSSGCFKFDIEDSMVSILEVGRKSGLVQKWGGGVGYYLGNIRAKDQPIKSTHGRACGPVAILHYYHAIAKLITQGGKREGAQMGILPCDHPDILEFINCKRDNPETLNTFNISVSCTDEFMDKASKDLGSKESKLLDKIAENAHANGDPGLYFVDTAERSNPTPHLGKLTGTNPCGENPLLDNEPCNLGSINLAKLVMKGGFIATDRVGIEIPSSIPTIQSFDFERLKEITRLAVDFLDEILDNNSFPDPVIDKAARDTRKIGLGVMGWADCLALMNIPYDSIEAIDLATRIMETIQSTGLEETIKLGREKGAYPESQNQDERNATVTCIAPTGSICVLADCSSGLEPHFALDYTVYMGDRTPLIRKVSVLDKYGDFVPKTAHEISWKWHIDHQAAFQEYVDLAVSKTVNLPNDTSVEIIRKIYLEAWSRGCKGVTVYREGCRPLQAMTKGDSDIPIKAFPDDDYEALTHRFKVGDMKGYLHWGLRPKDSQPGELFITASKQGSTVDGLLDAIAILMSISLQSGVSLEEIVDKMKGRRFEPAGLTKNSKIPTASSILDYIARYAEQKFLTTNSSYESGMFCPECSSPVISQEGCLVCSNTECGWSRC